MWRYALRLALLMLGLFTFSCGIVLTLGAGLGLSPWDVLHQGLSLHTPLSFGRSSIVVGGLVILASLLLRVRPGVATIANMLFVGLFIDALLGAGLLPDLRQGPLWARLLLDVVGVVVVGIGSALYIKAALGAGPRDSLMLALGHLTGMRVGLVRALIETAALALGFLLGGTVGVGTLIFALGVGPAVDLSFRLFGVPSPSRQREPQRG